MVTGVLSLRKGVEGGGIFGWWVEDFMERAGKGNSIRGGHQKGKIGGYTIHYVQCSTACTVYTAIIRQYAPCSTWKWVSSKLPDTYVPI